MGPGGAPPSMPMPPVPGQPPQAAVPVAVAAGEGAGGGGGGGGSNPFGGQGDGGVMAAPAPVTAPGVAEQVRGGCCRVRGVLVVGRKRSCRPLPAPLPLPTYR